MVVIAGGLLEDASNSAIISGSVVGVLFFLSRDCVVCFVSFDCPYFFPNFCGWGGWEGCNIP